MSTLRQVLKYFGLAIVGVMLLFGLYVGFVRLLGNLQSVPIVGPLLVSKILAMIFLTLFSMVVFSSAITSFTTLFGAKDLPFLLQCPLSFRTVFLFKSFQTMAYSSWMVVVAMIPFVTAYAYVKNVTGYFFLMVMGYSLPFLMIASGVGILAVLLLVGLFPGSRVRDVLLILGVIVGSGLYILVRFLEPERLVKADALDQVIQYVTYLQTPTAVYLPSWWITASLDCFTGKRWIDLLSYGGLLLGSAVVIVYVMVMVAEKLYYRGWVGAQETSGPRSNGPTTIRAPGWLAKLLPIQARVLMVKDIKVFF